MAIVSALEYNTFCKCFFSSFFSLINEIKQLSNLKLIINSPWPESVAHAIVE